MKRIITSTLRFRQCRGMSSSSTHHDGGMKTKEKVVEWTKTNVMLLIGVGSVLGAGVTSALIYKFYLDDPSAIEKLVVQKTVHAFASALNFSGRKKIYFGLPEFNFPVPRSPLEFAPNNNNNNSKSALVAPARSEYILAWANVNRNVSRIFDSSWLFTAKMEMRDELVREALKIEDLESRLAAIREVMPPSIERNNIISSQLLSRLESNGFVEAKYLEENQPTMDAESDSLATRLLLKSIAFFPGPISKFILFLSDKLTLEEMMNALDLPSTMAKEDKKNISEALTLVHTQFQNLDSRSQQQSQSNHLRQYALHKALTETITVLPELPSRNPEESPFELYKKSIEEDLLGPLRRDARITEEILTQVKQVFLALPPGIQARILLRAILHPVARGAVSNEDQARVVRDLLSSGGVVAVKLAQMLAEDPKVPWNYRQLLGGLRDDNEPMPLELFWWSLPGTVRSQIDFLGPCLGTGSVKQVHVARFQRKGFAPNDRAVATLRNYVEDEALASISALESSDELGPVATRLGRLVYGEFNLFGEGEALGEFALTSIGRHPDFRVVRVLHHSPKCLVEEIARGQTIGAVLDSPNTTKELKEKVLKKLVEYHRAVFEAFVQDGLIHSDIHLANAVVQIKNNSGDIGFVLFDVGQMDRIGFADTKALLWVLGSISSIERRSTLRFVALNNLAKVSTLQRNKQSNSKDLARSDTSLAIPPSGNYATKSVNDTENPSQVETTEATSASGLFKLQKHTSISQNSRNMINVREITEDIKKSSNSAQINHETIASEETLVRQLLEEAYVEAIKPFEDGTFPDQKQAYMLFLRACEKRNVALPKGAFSVAKMIDGMLSQMQAYSLPNVVEEQMEIFLKKHVTWSEMGRIIYSQIR